MGGNRNGSFFAPPPRNPQILDRSNVWSRFRQVSKSSRKTPVFIKWNRALLRKCSKRSKKIVFFKKVVFLDKNIHKSSRALRKSENFFWKKWFRPSIWTKILKKLRKIKFWRHLLGRFHFSKKVIFLREDLFSNLSVFLRGFPEEKQNEPNKSCYFLKKTCFLSICG